MSNQSKISIQQSTIKLMNLKITITLEGLDQLGQRHTAGSKTSAPSSPASANDPLYGAKDAPTTTQPLEDPTNLAEYLEKVILRDAEEKLRLENPPLLKLGGRDTRADDALVDELKELVEQAVRGRYRSKRHLTSLFEKIHSQKPNGTSAQS